MVEVLDYGVGWQLYTEKLTIQEFGEENSFFSVVEGFSRNNMNPKYQKLIDELSDAYKYLVVPTSLKVEYIMTHHKNKE